jgi:hypothetical protein
MAQILEARDLALGERLVGEILQRAPPPKSQGLFERLLRVRRAAGGKSRSTLGDQPLEAAGVEALGIEDELVSVLAGNHGTVRLGVCERLPQPGHVDLYRLGRRGRRTLAPELVDQPLGADSLVGV